MFKYFLEKLLLLSLTIAAGVTSLPEQSNAEDMSTAMVINIAGSQRMLSQRILKAYCLEGMQALPGKSKQQLNDAVARFSKQLDLLESFSSTEDYSNAVAKERQIWSLVKELVSHTPKKEDVIELRKEIEDLLQQSHAVVVALEEASGSSSGKLVSMAGRQRMLSQRIAALYMLQAWGIKEDTFSHDAELAAREFEAAMEELSSAEENTTAIEKKWREVAAFWRVFGLVSIVHDESTASLDGFKVKLVTDSADNILSLMNEITAMYEKL